VTVRKYIFYVILLLCNWL